MEKLNPPSRDILNKLLGNNHLMIKSYESIFKNDNDMIDELNAINEDLTRVKVGAGLSANGNYIIPDGTNYLDSSKSLADATILLDSAIELIDTRTKIINQSTSYQALSENQLIIVDCTSGNITITLPNPSDFIYDGYSKNIAITKKDQTTNEVLILPFGTEKIVNEDTQYLNLQGEILNFITDGSNWYLGA